MSTQVHFTRKSSNRKTGNIPTSTSSRSTCPPTCPLKDGGCYAASGPLRLHWNKVTEGSRGVSWNEFCRLISELPDGQLWRHAQAGDLPGEDGSLNAPMVHQLVEANRGARGYSYTHYPPTRGNAEVIRWANHNGFTINLSANNGDHADALAGLEIGPVVVLLPMGSPARSKTPAGRKIIKCPAQYLDDLTCATCRLCAHHDRRVIIGFEAHGAQRRRADRIAGAEKP